MASFTIAAQTPKQLAGVTISNTGRIFINFPRWVDEPTPSVAEVAADGSLVPYPNAEINEWDLVPGESAASHLVCVQSVVADGDTLWILDPASPMFAAVVPGGAKLLKVSLTTNEVEHIYHFDDTAAPVQSYLNDVRIASGSAFMSDSGLGAIVVLNLTTGNVRRLLENHPSTKAEPGLDVIIGGREWKFSSNHTTPQVHTDGIAIDPKLEYVYYKALTGRTLYRVPVAALLDESTSPDSFVERVAVTEPTDGLEFDADGNLYLTSLQGQRNQNPAPRWPLRDLRHRPRVPLARHDHDDERWRSPLLRLAVPPHAPLPRQRRPAPTALPRLPRAAPPALTPPAHPSTMRASRGNATPPAEVKVVSYDAGS